MHIPPPKPKPRSHFCWYSKTEEVDVWFAPGLNAEEHAILTDFMHRERWEETWRGKRRVIDDPLLDKLRDFARATGRELRLSVSKPSGPDSIRRAA